MGLAFIILAALGGSAFVYKKVVSPLLTGDAEIPTSNIPTTAAGLPPSSGGYDKGLSSDEQKALVFAIANEKDGRKLREFGQVMLPDFPVASSLLLSKSGFIIYRGKPAGSLNPSGPITKAASAALPPKVVTKTTTNIQAGQTFRGIASMHADWDPTGITDVVEEGANIAVDVVHLVPGVDELGEQLKDFAKTGFGEWALRVMATYGYYVMAPYLGAQLAAISFAFPGVMKADPFMDAWIKETIDRVIKTAQILLANQVKFPDLGNATSEAVNKFLGDNPAVRDMVKKATEQIGKATSTLQDSLGPEIGQMIKDNTQGALESAAQKLASQYGMPPDFAKMAKEAGVQEVNAAAAYDLIAKTNYQGTLSWDAFTGTDILGHMKKQRTGSVQTARTQISPGQQAIDRLNKEYRAKRPTVVKYYLQQIARQS